VNFESQSQAFSFPKIAVNESDSLTSVFIETRARIIVIIVSSMIFVFCWQLLLGIEKVRK
jgi:hypothetical protein